MPVIERQAIRYLNKIPPAISGNDGHGQTFGVAMKLVHGFCLDEASALSLLKTHYNLTCDPPWTDRELKHKVASAINTTPGKPRGWLMGSHSTVTPAASMPPKKLKPVKPEIYQDRVISWLDGFMITEPEAAEASTITIPETSQVGELNLQAHIYMEALYEPDDMVNIVTKSKLQGDRWVPTGWGLSYPVNVWKEEGISVQASKGGAWIGVNTFDDMGVCNDNVAGFPYVMVEHDDLPRDLQLSFLFKLGETAPLVAVIDTGGKSLHGIFKVRDVHSLDSYDRTVGVLYSRLAWTGIDRNCKTASRRTRLPGAIRGQRRQRLLYLSPDGTLTGKEVAK